MAGERPTRWHKAREDCPRLIEWRQQLVPSVTAGAIAVVVLAVLGFPGEALIAVVVTVGAAVSAALLSAAARLFWAWQQAPMRLLTADVIAIRERLEAAPAPAAPPQPPNVRHWLLEHIRKGQGLLGYYSGPALEDAEQWAAEASEFLREHVPDDAELFLLAPVFPDNTETTIQGQIRALAEIAERHRGPAQD